MEQPDTPVQDSAVAQAAPEPEAQIDDLDLEALDDQQADPDEIEDDLDGVKVRGRKDAVEKLKAERLMQADYTRKTQGVAEQARQIEAEKAANAESAKFFQSHLNLVGELMSVDSQLAQFAQVNWDQLSDADPAQAQKLERQYRALQDKRGQGLQVLAQMRQRHALNEQQGTAKQIEQAADYLKREIPGWSTDRDNGLREYAVKLGIPDKAIAQIVMQAPAVAKALHKAELYDRLVARQSKAPKPEAQEAPVTRINATRASVTKDPSKMSDSEFAAWRGRQIAQRR